MQPRNKALLFGAAIGTLFFGPGVGTALGASVAQAWHDATNGPPVYDDPKHPDDEPDYSSAS